MKMFPWTQCSNTQVFISGKSKKVRLLRCDSPFTVFSNELLFHKFSHFYGGCCFTTGAWSPIRLVLDPCEVGATLGGVLECIERIQVKGKNNRKGRLPNFLKVLCPRRACIWLPMLRCRYQSHIPLVNEYWHPCQSAAQNLRVIPVCLEIMAGWQDLWQHVCLSPWAIVKLVIYMSSFKYRSRIFSGHF